jgi:hypothetical protein
MNFAENDLSSEKAKSASEALCCGVKRSRVCSQEALTASCRRSICIGQSDFSHLVFVSVSTAIKVWEDAKHPKARNDLPKFNILATVMKLSAPQATKGVHSSK